MSSKINFKALLGMLASFYVAYLTAAGIMQQIIPFSDELNEIGFFILNLIIGGCCLILIKK
jgi:hypothetical protein|tara:strand:+ start:1035 stop:1217 length:183 start_codon:yes stop_codon:yes gene_type:complete